MEDRPTARLEFEVTAADTAVALLSGDLEVLATPRLVAWLDGGEGGDGRSYVEMHRRLAAYFARKACRPADDLADETLTRVARRLEEEGTIAGVPAHYCYIVARFVFLEQLRNPGHTVVPLTRDIPDEKKTGEDEPELSCLDQCLGALSRADRELILQYYAGPSDGRIATRRQLAVRLQVTANALAIRASRLRDRLRHCVGGCLGDRQVLPRSVLSL